MVGKFYKNDGGYTYGRSILQKGVFSYLLKISLKWNFKSFFFGKWALQYGTVGNGSNMDISPLCDVNRNELLKINFF